MSIIAWVDVNDGRTVNFFNSMSIWYLQGLPSRVFNRHPSHEAATAATGGETCVSLCMVFDVLRSFFTTISVGVHH